MYLRAFTPRAALYTTIIAILRTEYTNYESMRLSDLCAVPTMKFEPLLQFQQCQISRRGPKLQSLILFIDVR